MTHERELERLTKVYERYRASSWRSKWDPQNPGNRMIVAEREARLRTLLTDQGFLPWREQRLLEIGCGTGPWLELFLRWGAPPERLAGIDLIEERIAEARVRLPEEVELVAGDAAALPWPDAHFDLVLLSTVLSSVLEAGLAQRLAAEAWRVLRPGGAILWYDFRYDNLRQPGQPQRTGDRSPTDSGTFSGGSPAPGAGDAGATAGTEFGAGGGSALPDPRQGASAAEPLSWSPAQTLPGVS